MTDMVNGSNQGMDTSVSLPTPSQAPQAPSAPTPSEERMFRQSDVNDIVKKAKYGAVEDFKRLQTEQPSYAQQKFGDAQNPSSQSQQPNQSIPQEDTIRRMAAEEAQRLRDQWVQDATMDAQKQEAQRIVSEFVQKLSTGKDKYADFEQVTGEMDLANFPNVVSLANGVDNTADVMYELGKDRVKMASLQMLAERSPRDAFTQMQRLATSIKDNQAATKVRSPNEPLSQLRPSNIGTDNGDMSVSDYRKKYRG